MKVIVSILFLIFVFISGWYSHLYLNPIEKSAIESTFDKILEKPFEKYELERLSETEIQPGKIKIKSTLGEEKEYKSYLFEFEFNPNLDGKTKKVTTGQINIPSRQGSVPNHLIPVVLMFRGYVDQETYNTGDGTRRAAEYFANNGFITIAPDFLGYAGSDKESGNIFETRFQTYVTALSILKYLESNPELKLEIGNWEVGNLFIWGHSNGGQVALTLLEISGKNYPTALWAPVTKPFPYSVLYYTDDSQDGGKLIRRELAKFETLHDVEKYSLTNYLDKINAPIQLQQGLADDAIPFEWSREFTQNLKSLNKIVSLTEYPNTDHNMRPVWDEVAEKDVNFYKSYLN